jgi:hypothetical protein
VEHEPWESIHERLASEFNGLFEEEREEYGDLPGDCRRIFDSYLRFTRDDHQRYRTADLHSGEPAIEFVVEADLPNSRVTGPFKGRIDRLVEDAEYGGLWIWDYKWVKSIPDSDERMMSPQSIMYPWALQQMDYDVRGFLHYYGRTKAPAIPQVLKRPEGALSQRKNMDTDVATYVAALKRQYGKEWKVAAKTIYRDHLLQLKNREVLWFRRERTPIEPERMKQALAEFIITALDIQKRRPKNVAPRSYFYNCKRGCDYHGLCVAEYTGLNIDPLIKARYELVEERYAETEDLLSA